MSPRRRVAMRYLALPLSLAALALLARPAARAQPPGFVNGPEVRKEKARTPVKVQGPAPFTSKEGKKGCKVATPGRRPLATPAVAAGNVFLGGGFGSHEFYAFNATTGKLIWRYQTGDDGPTAAVV